MLLPVSPVGASNDAMMFGKSFEKMKSPSVDAGVVAVAGSPQYRSDPYGAPPGVRCWPLATTPDHQASATAACAGVRHASVLVGSHEGLASVCASKWQLRKSFRTSYVPSLSR